MSTLKTNLTNQALIEQNEIISAFFKTDNASEMVESLHFIVESLMFSQDIENITNEMRAHIVNQLRVATLLAKLGS